MEIAPDGMRTGYVGLANTLTGVMTIVPTLGGWLLQATSYTVLFGVAAALAGAGFVCSLSLAPAQAGSLPDQAEASDSRA